MHTTSTAAVLEHTLEAIKKNRPFYAELVDLFEPLFKAQSDISDKLAADGIPVPDVDAAKIDQGAHILATCDLAAWSDELQETAKALEPVIRSVLPDELLAAVPEDFSTDTVSLLKLAKARLNGEAQAFMNTSKEMNGIPPVLPYMIEAVLAPLLNAIRVRLGEHIPTEGWEQGSCPMCGSLPSLSWLSPREKNDLEHLVGGGGKKYLHCSLCGHDWRHRRDACPACGNDDQQQREVFTAEDNKRERIEACHKCGVYLLGLDLREYENRPHLDAVQLGLVHLDMLARERELQPLSPSVWNGIEP